jgi:hypothetical protein
MQVAFMSHGGRFFPAHNNSYFVAPIDDEEHLLFSCESTKDKRLRSAGLPIMACQVYEIDAV